MLRQQQVRNAGLDCNTAGRRRCRWAGLARSKFGAAAGGEGGRDSTVTPRNRPAVMLRFRTTRPLGSTPARESSKVYTTQPPRACNALNLLIWHLPPEFLGVRAYRQMVSRICIRASARLPRASLSIHLSRSASRQVELQTSQPSSPTASTT